MTEYDLFGICPICKEPKNLVKHHLLYEPEYTISVCDSCHLKIHTQMPQWSSPSKTRKTIELPKNPSIKILKNYSKSEIVLYCIKKYKIMPIFKNEKLKQLAEFGIDNSDFDLIKVLEDLLYKFPLEIEEVSQ